MNAEFSTNLCKENMSESILQAKLEILEKTEGNAGSPKKAAEVESEKTVRTCPYCSAII